MAIDAAVLIERWLDRLVACDLEGLADLYDPGAEVQAMHEIWKGRDEIEDALGLARKWLRGIVVEGVQPVHAGNGRWTFDTTVKGRLGRAKVRHTWLLAEGLILDHGLTVLRHDKTAS